MPRLSNDTYLHQRKRLHRYWRYANIAFGYLTPPELWDLHDFFCFTVDCSDTEALTHRQLITERRPGLARRAGRALAKLDQIAVSYAVAQVQAARRPITPQKSSTTHVLPVMKPPISDEALARIVAAFVVHQQKEQRR